MALIDFKKVYVGNRFVTKIYLGNTLVKYNLGSSEGAGIFEGYTLLTNEWNKLADGTYESTNTGMPNSYYDLIVDSTYDTDYNVSFGYTVDSEQANDYFFAWAMPQGVEMPQGYLRFTDRYDPIFDENSGCTITTTTPTITITEGTWRVASYGVNINTSILANKQMYYASCDVVCSEDLSGDIEVFVQVHLLNEDEIIIEAGEVISNLKQGNNKFNFIIDKHMANEVDYVNLIINGYSFENDINKTVSIYNFIITDTESYNIVTASGNVSGTANVRVPKYYDMVSFMYYKDSTTDVGTDKTILTSFSMDNNVTPINDIFANYKILQSAWKRLDDGSYRNLNIGGVSLEDRLVIDTTNINDYNVTFDYTVSSEEAFDSMYVFAYKGEGNHLSYTRKENIGYSTLTGVKSLPIPGAYYEFEITNDTWSVFNDGISDINTNYLDNADTYYMHLDLICSADFTSNISFDLELFDSTNASIGKYTFTFPSLKQGINTVKVAFDKTNATACEKITTMLKGSGGSDVGKTISPRNLSFTTTDSDRLLVASGEMSGTVSKTVSKKYDRLLFLYYKDGGANEGTDTATITSFNISEVTQPTNLLANVECQLNKQIRPDSYDIWNGEDDVWTVTLNKGTYRLIDPNDPQQVWWMGYYFNENGTHYYDEYENDKTVEFTITVDNTQVNVKCWAEEGYHGTMELYKIS